MLRKLLKYDLRAIFKYWWVAAISTLAVSVVGGVSLNILLRSVTEANAFVILLAYFGFLISILGLSAFMIASAIFIYLRFYKNFFSDEGYLTFTLPVKRSQLLNSKLIAAMTVLFSTFAVLLIDLTLIFMIAFGTEFINPEALKSIWAFIKELFNPINTKPIMYLVVYALEIVLITFLSSMFSVLLVFVCISFASMITKKNKVFAAIGIYYLVNMVLSWMGQILGYFTLFGSISWFALIPPTHIGWVVALALFIVILIFAAICLTAYTTALWLIDRKLNLA